MHLSSSLCGNCRNTGFFSGPYFPIFGLNTKIYGVNQLDPLRYNFVINLISALGSKKVFIYSFNYSRMTFNFWQKDAWQFVGNKYLSVNNIHWLLKIFISWRKFCHFFPTNFFSERAFRFWFSNVHVGKKSSWYWKISMHLYRRQPRPLHILDEVVQTFL